MAAIEHRFIADLAPESALWIESRGPSNKPRWSEVHLAQGALDSACGVHCIGMAALILLRLSRSEVLKMTTAKRGPLASLWHEARENYFEGTDARDLVRYVAALGGALEVTRHTGSSARIIQAASVAVLANQVPILRVVGRGFDHWTLVVGLERLVQESEPQQPLALLLLDPGAQPPWISGFNGRIDIAPRVHRRTAQQLAGRSYTYRAMNGDRSETQARSNV